MTGAEAATRRAALARARLALDDLLRSGTPLAVTVRGDSMAPTVAPGRRLRVQPLGARGPRLGEVVVISRGCTWTLHRVVRATGRRVWTRGDGRLTADPAFPSGAVVGRVSELRRRPGLALLGGCAHWAAAALRGRTCGHGARLAALAVRSIERVTRPLEPLV